MTTVLKARKELLASKVSNLVSDTNENLLRVNLTKFFTDLEAEIQKALMEYYNDTFMLQGQINLILAPIHEKHQEYYELIMRHKLQEFKRAKQSANRVVKREQKRVAMKSAKPVNFIHNRNNLFGTLQYSEDRLANNTFTASQNTLNRVDSNISQILTDGYRSGAGINEVGRMITERFDELRTWEANRIARTEIHTAQNMGIMSSYEDLGVEYTQWIAANDDRTRDSHIEIDGEIIAFGEQYSNGLSFPGDTSGPIEEWINCRCSNAPFVMPAGMMAPSFSPFKESDLVPIEVETPTVTEPQPVEPQILEPTEEQLKQNLTPEEYVRYTRTIERDIEGYTRSLETFKDDKKLVELFEQKIQDAVKEKQMLLEKALNGAEQTSFTISPLENYTLETLKADVPIEEKTFDELMTWSEKRATKNVIEYGYQFDTETGKLIGEEVRGKKGTISFNQQGTNIGSIHTHPPVKGEEIDVGGGSFPSKQDIKTYRSQRGADHLIGSPTEVWYVHAEENLGSSVLGQREIDAVYNKVYTDVSEKGQKLVKQGKLKTDDKSLRKFLNKEIGDGLLKEFDTPEWKDRGFYIRRAYR